MRQLSGGSGAGAVLARRLDEVLERHCAAARGVPPLQQDAHPPIVQQSRQDDGTVKELVAVAGQVERPRPPALRDACRIQGCASLRTGWRS